MRKLFIAVCCSVLFCMGTPAGAEEEAKTKSTTMEPVSVTATRVEKKEIEVPAFVDLISMSEIALLGWYSTYDILKRHGGLNFTFQMPFGLR